MIPIKSMTKKKKHQHYFNHKGAMFSISEKRKEKKNTKQRYGVCWRLSPIRKSSSSFVQASYKNHTPKPLSSMHAYNSVLLVIWLANFLYECFAPAMSLIPPLPTKQTLLLYRILQD